MEHCFGSVVQLENSGDFIPSARNFFSFFSKVATALSHTYLAIVTDICPSCGIYLPIILTVKGLFEFNGF